MHLLRLALLFVLVAIYCNAKTLDPEKKIDWWKKGVIYQIYTKSFKDSDNDGYGDIRGIISKLDYLSEIGIDIIWLNPIYPSGGKDNGYDVISHLEIDPLYGTMDDFDLLVKEVHQRGMYILMDFVINHTSDKHPWFLESKKNNDESNIYRDYYVWKTTNSTIVPPNNWISFFEGSAWQFDQNRQQWYLHQFLKEQPDLNPRNNNVKDELKNIVRFWLEEKQVDGLRVDAPHTLYENKNLLDEPLIDENMVNVKNLQHADLHHIYTQNQPETFEIITELREFVDDISRRTGKEKMMVTEVYAEPSITAKYCKYNNKPGASFPFNFQLVQLNNYSISDEGILKPNVLLDLIDPWVQSIGPECWSSWVIGNHDNSRIASRLGYKYVDMMNALNLLLGGTPTTYYGEEIGMEDLPKEDLSFEQCQDEAGKVQGPELFWMYSRDYERTPMQWSAKTNTGGFTDVSNVETWLPVNNNYRFLNVESQLKSESKRSHLRIYQDLIKIRQERSFQTGMLRFALINKEIFSFIRHEPGFNGYLVAMNFGEKDLVVNFHYTDQLPKNAEIVYFFASTEEDNEYLENRFRPGSIISTKKVPLKAKSLIIISYEEKKRCDHGKSVKKNLSKRH